MAKKIIAGISSAWQPVWGEYDEAGYRKNGPYTVFQHHKGDISDQLATIHKKNIFTHL